MRTYKHAGFTLIELVIVIVIGSILAIGSVAFISRSTAGFIDTGQRQQLAATAWIISQKFARDIRAALPNSVRLNADNSCIEFIPTVAASEYVQLPLANNQLSAVQNSQFNASHIHRAVVYPINTATLYTLGINAQISPLINSVSTISGIDTFTLASNFSFTDTSPSQRVFFIEQPVIYCFTATFLQRDFSYGFDNAIGDSFSSASSETIASQLINGSGSFRYNNASLTRNAVVNMSFDLQFAGDDEIHAINHEVQIRNVP